MYDAEHIAVLFTNLFAHYCSHKKKPLPCWDEDSPRYHPN